MLFDDGDDGADAADADADGYDCFVCGSELCHRARSFFMIMKCLSLFKHSVLIVGVVLCDLRDRINMSASYVHALACCVLLLSCIHMISSVLMIRSMVRLLATT